MNLGGSMKFVASYTEDGSIGLYNPEVGDIYHSVGGAYQEASDKFVEPLGGDIYSKKSLRCLDICYGMGYNSLALIQKCLDVGYDGELVIDFLEFDEEVVAFSFLAEHKNLSFSLMDFLDFSIFKNRALLDAIYLILDNSSLAQFISPFLRGFFEENKNSLYGFNGGDIEQGFLHNIYYKNVSRRYIKNNQNTQKRLNIRLVGAIGDARNTIQELDSKYDFVFLDAFTPIKLPTLWSVEFFYKIYHLLKDDGVITTYSNSAIIRNGMREVGFFLGRTKYGTIAYKQDNINKIPLDDRALGLLDTRAGIPFYDSNLSSSKEEILSKREQMVNASTLLSSSQYFKKFQKRENLDEK